ncbi:CNDP dipeptidase [Cystobasidium minutum MCA 4210]|uniref:CNDP dipeptidase n=1 Tax=Cystobasidium minutum MCA 4210 TaxID=1397322 RepID=UPI0034CE2967|eukprot:jgi/Rhomi1/189301/estExt_fgenesh1_pg.C_3_t20288
MSFADWVENNQQHLIDRLAEVVRIPSVSGDAAYRPHVFAMAEWLQNAMRALNIDASLHALGKQTLDGKELDLPPIVLGQYGNDPNKKTILVYGHYDVQPALKEDGWTSEPFELHHDLKSGRLYGRGSTDDKGPVLGWLNVIEAHQQSGQEFPVNLKMCFEGMEESGSEGLDGFIEREKDAFFAGVDAVCISDNYWLTTSSPAITYGLRGLMYQKIVISGPGADLHSGVFGGTVHEPMTDLVHLFSKLVSPSGEILIPGIKELVAPLTDEERQRYEKINFQVSDLESAAGGKITLSDDKVDVLMGRMRYPSLSIHGVEGAFSAPGAKTVIPAKVQGKYSIRLVPNLLPDQVAAICKGYLEAEFAKLGSKNTLTVETLSGGKPWVSDVNHWNYQCGIKATEKVYNQTPDLTREGGSIPCTLSLQDILHKNVMLLPMGRSDDGAHSINEKLDIDNYIRGTKLLGEYLHEVSKVEA